MISCPDCGFHWVTAWIEDVAPTQPGWWVHEHPFEPWNPDIFQVFVLFCTGCAWRQEELT